MLLANNGLKNKPKHNFWFLQSKIKMVKRLYEFVSTRSGFFPMFPEPLGQTRLAAYLNGLKS